MDTTTVTKQEQFIIAGIRNGDWSMTTRPRIHTDRRAAEAEAERLARTSVGVKFTVLQLCGTVTCSGIVWS